VGKTLLAIPILGELYKVLNTGGPLVQVSAALLLFLVVPFGGYILLFWCINKIRRCLKRNA